MSDSRVLFEKDPGRHIALLDLNRFERKNGCGPEMGRSMCAATTEVAVTDDIEPLLQRGAMPEEQEAAVEWFATRATMGGRAACSRSPMRAGSSRATNPGT